MLGKLWVHAKTSHDFLLCCLSLLHVPACQHGMKALGGQLLGSGASNAARGGTCNWCNWCDSLLAERCCLPHSENLPVIRTVLVRSCDCWACTNTALRCLA